MLWGVFDQLWAYFFVPQEAPLPDGLGFGVFSPTHLGVVAVLAAAIAVLVVVYRHATSARRRKLRLTMGWFTLALEVLRQIGIIASSLYDPSYLPLHMCALVTFVVFVDSVHSTRWSREPLYALGVWSASAAVLFPDWASRPIFNIYTWQAFVIHACIVGYALMRLVAGELVPTWRNLWRVLVIMACFIAVSIWANATLGTNFWFLQQGAPGSPLAPIQTFAGAFYIPVLVLLLAILWTIMYLPWALAARRTLAELPNAGERAER